MTEPRTWHYGLVARWWAEFNVDGPEIEYFRRFVDEGGEPVLDVACGTGRLLLPYLRAGLDVDGCDISPDMLALCREQAEREGFSPALYAQATHELDLPRSYRTVIVCGGLALGGDRAYDLEALRRFHDLLEPGGVIALDNQVPYSYSRQWPRWPKSGRHGLPEPWPEEAERRRGSDGAEYALRSRLVELDPLEQRVTLQLRASMWRDGELVAEEDHELAMMLYFRDEIVLMLERAGFSDVHVEAGYTGAEPTSEDDFLVFVARK